jgi:hypothetical protein
MRDRRLKRLPVTRDGHLIGIISRTDALSVFCRPDESIRHEVIEEAMRGGYLVRSQPSGVIVHEGIVTLTGRPKSGEAGHGLTDRVRHIEGVVTVLDRLSYARLPDALFLQSQRATHAGLCFAVAGRARRRTQAA